MVATPGHTDGHVSLFLSETGLLFAADALTVAADTPRGPPEGMTADRERALVAVADLADLPVMTVLAYHGGLIEADGATLAAVADADANADADPET